MRTIARGVLLLFIFSIPWEYSLDWGEPVGHIARVLGLLLVPIAVLAVIQEKRLRAPGPMQWVVLAFYLWFCCSCFWSVDIQASLDKLRGLAQEMMIVWFVWEFIESPDDLRASLRAFVAGSVVLATLSLANYSSINAALAGQVRVAAAGQDPNDMARFLDLGLASSAMLLMMEHRGPWRLLALCSIPLGSVAVLLTASRSGFLAGIVALSGCALLLARRPRRFVPRAIFALPALAAGLWFAVPHQVFARIGTIPEQVESGDLNQRSNIWLAGLDAFARAPVIGSGVGTFVSAADLAPIDTAHNTMLSIMVSGGLCALSLAVAIVAVAIACLLRVRGALRWGMVAMLLVLGLTSLVATVEENRTTWFVLALIAVAGRCCSEDPDAFAFRTASQLPLFRSPNGPRSAIAAAPITIAVD